MRSFTWLWVGEPPKASTTAETPAGPWVARAEAIRRWSVVAGMSMGGYVALAFAERHPARQGAADLEMVPRRAAEAAGVGGITYALEAPGILSAALGALVHASESAIPGDPTSIAFTRFVDRPH